MLRSCWQGAARSSRNKSGTEVRARLTSSRRRGFDRGLLDRENIALPGRSLGLWLHRINERGAIAIGAPAPAPVGPPESEGLRTIFTDQQWAALEFMRKAKTEPSPARFATREQAQQAMTESIEIFYNRQRLQARLGYLSPAAFLQPFYQQKEAA